MIYIYKNLIGKYKNKQVIWKEMIKAVIFDMDGVLVDSLDAWFSMFNRALMHFEKKKISKEEFNNRVWAVNFNKTAKEYFSVDRSEIIQFFNKTKKEMVKEILMMEGAKQTLEILQKEGKHLSIATNTHSELATEMLKKLGLLKYFDFVLGGDSVANGKPEPDLLLKTISLLKLDKKEAMFIGDTVWDKIAAQRANVYFIGFGIDGDKRIDKLKELPEALL
jgi:HAD superfamily hydrolase (TIGR01549 family)